MRVFLSLVLLGALSLSATSLTAYADPAPAGKPDPDKDADKSRTELAKQYTNAGIAAQNAGDYDTAIELYTKAFQLVPHPLLIFNTAQANRLAGRKDRALLLYRRYIETDPNGAQVQTARDLINELDPPKPPPPPPAPPPPIAPPPKAIIAPAARPPAAEPARAPAPAPAPTVPLVTAVPASTTTPSEREAPSDHRGAWKAALITTGAVAVAGFAFAGISYAESQRSITYRPGPSSTAPNAAVTPSECGANLDTLMMTNNVTFSASDFKNRCSWHTAIYVGYAVAGVATIGAAVSAYMLFLRDRESHEPTARARRPRHDVAIAPIIGPQASGAQLSLTF